MSEDKSSNTGTRSVMDFRVDIFPLKGHRDKMISGQAEVVVHANETYTFICSCGEHYDGDLKRVDISTANAQCPEGDVTVPLFGASKGPGVYRFSKVNPAS